MKTFALFRVWSFATSPSVFLFLLIWGCFILQAYLDELVELHRRLMTLRERHILQQVRREQQCVFSKVENPDLVWFPVPRRYHCIAINFKKYNVYLVSNV